MFQQDCYDHVPVDDVYNEDVVVGFHGVQAEILRKEPPSEEVSAVEESETWMTPLIRYLEADTLPEGRSEARKIKKQAARYCISHEKLYRRSFAGRYLRCVTPREAARILVELHEGDCGSHSSGRSLVLRARRAGYYWPTMAADADRQAKHCQQRPPILANPHKSGTTTVARPQRIKTGMRHKAGMGMRKPEEHMVYTHCKIIVKYKEQSKSCFSRRGKQRKPGTWVITPTPAPSKHVPVVVLPRKTEYGPCEKQNIPGSQGTPGLYASPLSKEETQGSKEEPPGSYTASGFRKKLEPLYSLGRIGVIATLKNLRVPKKRSPDPNLRVPTWPQRHNTILAKRIEPLCSLGHIGVVTSLKNLRVPMRPQCPSASGPRYDLRI
ncbi:hypothetical protein DY000_02016193 [Brassica cretica]|uniref:Integrase zinc-binding domain-containing protein n=1 Tax=Brassica cretica TaxID=69181 RepID=A0ABQ7D1P2_BRACR|nr:hypothetical protein DY000_02016193 [Brassica cretica]